MPAIDGLCRPFTLSKYCGINRHVFGLRQSWHFGRLRPCFDLRSKHRVKLGLHFFKDIGPSTLKLKRSHCMNVGYEVYNIVHYGFYWNDWSGRPLYQTLTYRRSSTTIINYYTNTRGLHSCSILVYAPIHLLLYIYFISFNYELSVVYMHLTESEYSESYTFFYSFTYLYYCRLTYNRLVLYCGQFSHLYTPDWELQ